MKNSINFFTNFLLNPPSSVMKATNETVLHLVLKMQSDAGTREDYQHCLDLLLDPGDPECLRQMKKLVNKKDDRGNTALHYASQKWSEDTVRRLLELGANIGIKNYWDEIPITNIRPETLENYLSEFCLRSSGDVNHDKFSLTFKYDFLAPNIDALPEKYRSELGDQESLLSGKV